MSRPEQARVKCPFNVVGKILFALQGRLEEDGEVSPWKDPEDSDAKVAADLTAALGEDVREVWVRARRQEQFKPLHRKDEFPLSSGPDPRDTRLQAIEAALVEAQSYHVEATAKISSALAMARGFDPSRCSE